MNWTNENTLLFIEDYHNSPELWNTKINLYKDIAIKNDKLNQLASKYNCTVIEVKNKIKNLRSAFHRERKKLESKKSGLFPGKKGKWFAYEVLSFLLDVVDDPKSTSSIAGSDKSDFEEEDHEVSQGTLYTQGEANEFGKLHELNNKRGRDNTEEKFEKYIVPKTKRKVLSSSDREEDTYSFYGCQRDDSSIYGEYVASELRHLSSKARIMAKHLINNTLFEAAMGKYDEPSPCSTPHCDT